MVDVGFFLGFRVRFFGVLSKSCPFGEGSLTD